MSSLKDDLLPIIDEIRGIPNSDIGIYNFDVFVRVRTWTGSRPFEPGSTFTDVDTPIHVGLGKSRPKVSYVTQKDIVASGGLFTDQDLKVGPITPACPGGGVAISTLDPPTAGTTQEIFWNVAGNGQPSGGGWYRRIGADNMMSLHYLFYLRRTADVP